jgi:hypothetical protein
MKCQRWVPLAEAGARQPSSRSCLPGTAGWPGTSRQSLAPPLRYGAKSWYHGEANGEAGLVVAPASSVAACAGAPAAPVAPVRAKAVAPANQHRQRADAGLTRR